MRLAFGDMDIEICGALMCVDGFTYGLSGAYFLASRTPDLLLKRTSAGAQHAKRRRDIGNKSQGNCWGRHWLGPDD